LGYILGDFFHKTHPVILVLTHAARPLQVLLDATKTTDGVNGSTAPMGGALASSGLELANDNSRASQGTEVRSQSYDRELYVTRQCCKNLQLIA
jgi:hypothetical protein